MRFPPHADRRIPGAAQKRRLFSVGILRLFACAFLALVLSAPEDAAAHGRRAGSGPVTGLPIPSLSHGEMAVLAAYRAEIMRLADRVQQTDPTFRRLKNYAAIQYSYCLWGVGPGTISDEESPFNECAHAYMAAAKALLLHMRTMPGATPAVETLVSALDADMIRAGAALISCQYSAETFNTAEVVTPHWENLPTHPPTLAAALVTALVIPGVVILPFLRGNRTRSARPPELTG